MKVSKELKHRRRINVKELYFVRKYPYSEVVRIMAKQGWSESTIARDLKAIRTMNEMEIDIFDIKEVLTERIENHKKIINRLWRLADDEENPTKESQIIMKISRVLRMFIEDLQELGKIPKVAESININLGQEVHQGEKEAKEFQEKIDARERELKKIAIKRVRENEKRSGQTNK